MSLSKKWEDGRWWMSVSVVELKSPSGEEPPTGAMSGVDLRDVCRLGLGLGVGVGSGEVGRVSWRSGLVVSLSSDGSCRTLYLFSVVTAG